MHEILQIVVKFSRNEIIGQLFCLHQTDLISDDHLDQLHLTDSGQSVSNRNDRQIVVYSDFCQTIRFLKELHLCPDYRLKVFNRLKSRVITNYRFHSCGLIISNDSILPIDQNDQGIHRIKVVIKLKSTDHCLTIDKNWTQRILKLVVLRFRVEDSLSWLSTLGGAYSSLGEYNVKCAVKAGQISISQLHLAAITGDLNLIARCGIYMAYSLCQQNRRGDAIKMIRRTLYPFIIKIKNCDKIVISMYSSLCYRINNNFENNFNKISKH